MRLLFILFLILITSTEGFSQSPGFRYGFRFGAGKAKINQADLEPQTGKPAFNAGLISNYQINKNIGLVAELLFTSKGSRTSGSNTQCCLSYNYEDVYKLYYAEVPVMAKVSIGISDLYMKLFSGPSINFNLKGIQTRTFEDSVYNKNNGFSERKIAGLNYMELSWVAGAGFEVELEENDILFLDIRVNKALNPLGTINGRSAYNDYFAVGVGYLY